MLNNATGFRKIYIAAGYTDLRRGIDGLASIIKFNFQLDPYEKDFLFLFCGRRSDRIKGLVWEGDGFLLLYKRLELGANVNHFFTLLGKMFFTPYGKEFFTYLSKQIFTS